MKLDLRNKLVNEEGYHLYEKLIPSFYITDLNKRLLELYPVRASSSDKIYAEKDDIKNLPDISVWWSQTVENFPEVTKIKRIIDPIVLSAFPKLQFYASDIVTINKGSKWISPHVDTPHRFAKYNFDKRLLGIQCIVSLSNIDSNSASTGLVPYSQKRDFEINKCYTGHFDRWFLDNVKQHNMPKGSLLLYNCRVLHSSMPNPTSIDRPALLLNYLDTSIVKDIAAVDNVWSSNGKRP